MRASSGTSPASVLSLTAHTPAVTPSAPAPADDEPASFADHLVQQDAATPAVKVPVAAPSSPATPAAPVVRTMVIVPPATLAPGAVSHITMSGTLPRATTAPAAPTAPTPSTAPVQVAPETSSKTNATNRLTTPARATTLPEATAGTGADAMPVSAPATIESKPSTPSHAPAPVSAAIIASWKTGAATSSPAQKPADGNWTARDSSTTSGSNPAPISAGSDLATMMVQAMVLAYQAVATPAATPVVATSDSVARGAKLNPVATAKGREIPLSASSTRSTSSPAKEKNSTAGATERSFIQSAAPVASPVASASTPTATAVIAPANGAENQQVATPANSEKSASGSGAASAISTVGTAHDQRKATMNSNLDLADMITDAAARTISAPAPEVNILLSSNHDFEDALKQVVHIAQLNDASATPTPTRVAIELQTPPGAIVNVYVSKHEDTYRAQLSATDPAALSWVQDKIAALRQSNDLGVEVKWLPAQLEANSPLSATTPSSDGSNLNWNRDGQQHHNPTPDDRPQSQRQDPSSLEDLTEAEAESFAASFATLGGAA